eukprot:Plantae.Rhodophyta-Rhodochaete_pulchella.ctg9584.p1 GENE.Plantae.Rhodophyta-Rhodochaete_pulchella.ctg9584~~Plantae.Rhodophyta-Rhodochaete_pulchella.ctg9584.p1  ORF type:complete len:367 (-),score=50.87 Plantae.Rhodophyta-Rhodochaete_pulchella.ctg9584:595-1695(-)
MGLFDWNEWKRTLVSARGAIASSIKDLVMSDIEITVRAVTNDSPGGASGADLDTIAEASFNRDEYALMMTIVAQRLDSRRWRCVYKALCLFHHLILYGSKRSIEDARSCIGHIDALRNFTCLDPSTRIDQGRHVRRKAAELYCLLADDERLAVALSVARETRRVRDIEPEGFYVDDLDAYIDRDRTPPRSPRVEEHPPAEEALAMVQYEPPAVSVDDLLGMGDGAEIQPPEAPTENDWTSEIFAKAGIDLSPTTIFETSNDPATSQTLALMPPPTSGEKHPVQASLPLIVANLQASVESDQQLGATPANEQVAEQVNRTSTSPFLSEPSSINELVDFGNFLRFDSDKPVPRRALNTSVAMRDLQKP